MDMSLRRCRSSSELKSDEDVLTLILLLVPWRKLMSLKCVSKQWLSLITSPHFSRLRNLLPLRASGLFIQRPPVLTASGCPCPNKVYFVPLDDPNTPSPFRTLTFAHDPFDPERIRITQSCNGLLLCSTSFFAPREQLYCYVYNPSTNQLATLPKITTGNWVYHIGLAFDPSKSLHYKVIAFVPISGSDNVGEFQIYSSETGTWRVSRSVILAPRMYFKFPVYFNGCMHWLSELDIQSVPDSAVSDCLYFNVDEEKLETFPRPPIGARSTSRSLYFGESEGHLHFTEVCPHATSLNVYEMKTDYSGWFVKYRIDLAPISTVFPEMKGCFVDKNDYAVAVLSLIRRENFWEDSFLVLEIPGKAIHYNLVDRSFKVIWDFGVDFSLKKDEYWHFGRLKAWQYIESLSCV